MNNISFTNAQDLYNRLFPALRSKKKELHSHNYKYITEVDIWNYLKDRKWKNNVNLTLYDMVNDILYSDNDLIDEYTRNTIYNHHLQNDN